MDSVLIMQCFTCKASLLSSALYAKRPYYLVLHMQKCPNYLVLYMQRVADMHRTLPSSRFSLESLAALAFMAATACLNSCCDDWVFGVVGGVATALAFVGVVGGVASPNPPWPVQQAINAERGQLQFGNWSNRRIPWLRLPN